MVHSTVCLACWDVPVHGRCTLIMQNAPSSVPRMHWKLWVNTPKWVTVHITWLPCGPIALVERTPFQYPLWLLIQTPCQPGSGGSALVVAGAEGPAAHPTCAATQSLGHSRMSCG